MRTNKFWTEEEDAFLVENYNKCDVNSIFPYRTKSSIRSRANKLGICDSRNKYSVNESFFESPNILNSYYAGLIASDGHIIKNKIGQKSLNITSIDKHILESFINDIKYSGQIYELKKQKKTYKIKYKVTITSNILCDDLYKNWNITPKKSLTLLPPIFDDRKLIMSYIKGFMDGDGGIYNRKGLLGVGFTCASLDFIYWIKYNIGTPNKIQLKGGKRKNKCYSLFIVGEKSKIILNEIYSLDTPYLFRKKEIYDGLR
jgi:hypothetical protein